MAREISEHDATVAVDAAARNAYERNVKNYADQVPSYDALDPVTKLGIKDAVLPIVWAALGALPDHRHTAWLEGHIAADNGRDASTNPYPAEEA